MRILVVEDDPMLLDGLTVGLGLAGFTIDPVSSCADASAAIAAQRYDAIVLDLMLPDGSGLDVLASLRGKKDLTPVLLLTARDQVLDRIAGLDAGADDYVGKPFDLDELVARLRAVMERPSATVSKDALYGWQEEVESNAVKVHIHHLRHKLEGCATGAFADPGGWDWHVGGSITMYVVGTKRIGVCHAAAEKRD